MTRGVGELGLELRVGDLGVFEKGFFFSKGVGWAGLGVEDIWQKGIVFFKIAIYGFIF